MKSKNHLLIFLLGFACLSNVYSQKLPADNLFFNPTVGTATQTIEPSAGAGDDSLRFTNAINTVNAAGGGTVSVNAGTYSILEVDLKSNVHIEINSGVTLLPFNPSTTANNALFNADTNIGIKNFSIIGVDGKFTVDLSSLATTIRIRVIAFSNCTNFKVSNFYIIDGVTEFSSLAFGGNFITTGSGDARRISEVRGVPNHGIIENISMLNGHYGYGLVQVQGGNNLLFRNLACVGGVTLRLETGYDLIQYTDSYNFSEIKLDNIWGRTIECTNGQSALQLSPHTLDQGYFNIENIIATSCEAAVVWSAGFTTDDQEVAGLTVGSFDSTSKVRNVTSTFGQNAQLHSSKRLRYMPCALRIERANGIGIATTLNSDGESRMGPSIGAVLREDDKPGDYNLDFSISEVTANGYNIEAYYLPEKAFFTNSYDDYELCDESSSDINFWIPSEFRDTPNPRNPLENGSLSVNEFKNSEVKIYPNPSNGILTIDFPQSIAAKSIRVFNVLGKEVKSFKMHETNKIDLSHLTKGIYFFHIENESKQKIVLF
ncbi:T9SS type A sorting domain-containing protein [Formosa sp. PL04]|uniref:T9SS type A sorting domain-containing protein n=1 Tax=Formosa sp. PL04 TaxID=3081755 RepID=UPI00298259F1|nr:T9SS type A sorting domain-containing protein [Formosa sp. PL04]MDW5288091.1 T9SS type A sorting domain-containing protein [Formosa sp. PL04]